MGGNGERREGEQASPARVAEPRHERHDARPFLSSAGVVDERVRAVELPGGERLCALRQVDDVARVRRGREREVPAKARVRARFYRAGPRATPAVQRRKNHRRRVSSRLAPCPQRAAVDNPRCGRRVAATCRRGGVAVTRLCGRDSSKEISARPSRGWSRPRSNASMHSPFGPGFRRCFQRLQGSKMSSFQRSTQPRPR